MSTRKEHVIAFRVSESDYLDWSSRAKGAQLGLSAWLRQRVAAEPLSDVRLVSSSLRAGISITVTNDNRWQTWIAGAWFTPAREHPWCCEAGHERLEDAIDHGVSILRSDLLAERDTWPAGSIGAQLLARVPADG